MIKRITIALICTMLPSISFANCGSVPDAPELLEQGQLTTQQVESLSPLMEVYADSIIAFRACIDNQISSLAPADADEAYFDSTEYQTDFQNLVNLSDVAEQAVTFSEERFNYLIENASTEQ